jgi:hypothetical protein
VIPFGFAYGRASPSPVVRGLDAVHLPPNGVGALLERGRKVVRSSAKEITHAQLFALVKVALKGLAMDKSAPHAQRMREIQELRDDCNAYMEATCACAVARALRGA